MKGEVASTDRVKIFITIKTILAMAEMDTSGGGGHKKGPGVKKAKKAINQGRPYTNGGS